MNPYLEILKMKKGVPQALPKLTEAPSVSSVSKVGVGISEIHTPSVTSVSAVGIPFLRIDLVREFMEIDGMSLEAATALAVQCPAPRPADEWLAMIRETDALIAIACRQSGLDGQALDRVLAARNYQALSTIPETLQWLRAYVESNRT